MKKKQWHLMMSDRYRFDFKECPLSKGWAQVDTYQDASYYGNWANPFELKLVSYAEGDVCETACESVEEFVNELLELKLWHNEAAGDRCKGFKGVDCGCGDTPVKRKFIEIGLEKLIH